jgi:hypothetical protein
MTDVRDFMIDPSPRSRMRPLLFVLALAALGLAAWFGWKNLSVEREPNRSGPIKANDIQGTWAWLGRENCKAFFRTLSFSGDRIYTRDDGQGLLDVQGAVYKLMPSANDNVGNPVVSVAYQLGGNNYEARYKFTSRNEMSLIDDLKNGERNPQIDRARGRPLMRCSQRDPMPEIGSTLQPFTDDTEIESAPQ